MKLPSLFAVRAVPLASVIVLSLACSEAALSPPTAAPRTLAPAAPSLAQVAVQSSADHVLIRTAGVESSALTAAIAAHGGVVERRHGQLNLVVVRGLSATAVSTIASRSDVSRLTLDRRVRWLPVRPLRRVAGVTPLAPRATAVDQSSAAFYPRFQWNMRVTKANEAWLSTPEGDGAKVFVLDTGIDPTHLDLHGKVDVANSASFAEAEPGDVRDLEGHGTFVSAIITSNGIGVASVAPLARITAVKVLDASGSGTFADLISGILYAADKGADVINMSLGALIDASDPDAKALLEHLQSAISYARQRGAVVIAASGNDGLDLLALPPSILSVPAELNGVISVGATAPTAQKNFDMLASYSNFGLDIGSKGGVQLVAPGGDLVAGGVLEDLIISACSQFAPFGCGPTDYLIGAGTSFAAPMVSGAGAVLRSMLGRSLPASGRTYTCILHGTDEIGAIRIYGRGRLNVMKAAACARAGASPAVIASN
jgi:subtilisin family serine protease